MTSRLPGRVATAVGSLRVAAVSRDPEKVRHLSELLGADNGAVALEIWPADWPAGSTKIARLIERQRPDVLLLDAQVVSGDDFSVLEQIMARYPEMSVLLLGVPQQPECVLVALQQRMRRLRCIRCGKWQRCELPGIGELDCEYSYEDPLH